jgi:hypothetical protein
MKHVTSSMLTITQEEDDEKAHLLCADGAIFNAPESGKFTSSVLGRTAHELDISVYA